MLTKVMHRKILTGMNPLGATRITSFIYVAFLRRTEKRVLLRTLEDPGLELLD